MNNEEVIVELEYMLQRGVSPLVSCILNCMIGALKTGDEYGLAEHIVIYAKRKLGLDRQ